MLTKGARCLKCTNCICFGLGTGRSVGFLSPYTQRAPWSAAASQGTPPGASLQSQAQGGLEPVPALGWFHQGLSPLEAEVGKDSFSVFSEIPQ